PSKETLTEYWVPSQNKLWAECPPNTTADCGVANVLQFSVGSNDKLWFTEWTENKLGRVDTEKQVPFTISALEKVTVARGNTAEIKMTISASGDLNGKMISASSITPTGLLGNSTG